MTANHPEELVARLKETAGKIATSAQDGDAELWASAEAGLWDAATIITSLVGERDALRAASAADVEALSEATKLHFDTLVKLQAAESTIRNRDETIAALRAADNAKAKDWATFCSDIDVPVDTHEAVAERIATLFEALDQMLDDMGDEYLCVCQAAKDQAIEARRALASPHQEGTGT